MASTAARLATAVMSTTGLAATEKQEQEKKQSDIELARENMKKKMAG